MQRTMSFRNDSKTLYLVATPIGNLSEMTPRAIEVLKAVDVIAVEDTRVTGKLLKHFEIENKMIVHQKHNEQASSDGIIKLLEQGKDVALVSDAGYPLISDPGQSLVNKAISHGFNVVPISGSSAILNAVIASGLDTSAFSFIGFLPIKQTECRLKLSEIENRQDTLVFYEAPHRLKKTLAIIEEELGNRYICIAREITKQYEEFIRGDILTIIEELDEVKGEIVIVVEGRKQIKHDYLNIDLIKMVQEEIRRGMTASEAIKYVSKQSGVNKNHLYKIYHSN
ncbi:MAG: 16S rRNA (cytidine(1402)-2'-O)-methyltransferase [Erysipelothrix sp.]|nr:16S rRNA (cytidine(1402)-2'-O)-methyltransferase [Erysipelothrix sp.]